MSLNKGKLTVFVMILALSLMGISASGADVSTDYDDSTELTITTFGVQLNYRNITQEGTIEEGGNSILNNNQGDVNTETNVTLNFTSTDGDIGSVNYFNITAWFDEGSNSNYYDDVSGANYRWKLMMENTSNTGNEANWSLESTHPNNEVIFNDAERLYHNQTTQNWTISINFNYQVKHALPDDGAWGGTPDTQNTWNVNWTSSQPVYDLNTTWHNEFGIYKYVYVSSSSDPTGSGAPGETISGDSQNSLRSNVTFRTNDAFNISTQFNNTLDNGPNADADDGTHSIPINNVGVRTDWVDGIGSYETFSSLGEEVMLNFSGGPHAAYPSGIEQEFDTYWQVSIPLGQYADTYKTTIIYKIQMEANL